MKKIAMDKAHSLTYWFEKQKDAFSDQNAIVCGSQSLTYSQLDFKANQLANYLIKLNIGRGNVIGVLAERNLSVVICVLAILKIGGICLPIDPIYPKNYVNFILNDVKVKILLGWKNTFSDDNYSIPTFNIDIDSDLISKQEKTKPKIKTLSKDIAFIIYTSGTTGNPKGVLFTHTNLYHYVNSLNETLKITNTDRYLHTASMAFSSAIRQLFLPLLNGGTIVMATHNEKQNPLLLFSLIKKEDISIIDLVPSHWSNCLEFLSELSEAKKSDILQNKLRLALSASESLLPYIPELWYKKLGQKAKFINMYGLTETSGIIATYTIPKNYSSANNSILPVGKALKNIQTYILDQELKLVPPLTTGMLYVGGPTITKGYLNQELLTKQYYIQNPFEKDKKSYLYKTGDLFRYNTERELEYIGRIDNQLKIKGIRIEAEQIEAILNRHPEIKRSLVINKEINGVEYLVAFFIKKIEKNVVYLNDLRNFMRNFLSETIIPNLFVNVDKFSLNANGKIDRALLPPITLESIAREKNGKITSSIGRELARIWINTLKTTQENLHLNFFELGGNSLLAHQLIFKIVEVFHINIPLAIIFDNPSLFSLIKYIEARLNEEKTDCIREKGIL